MQIVFFALIAFIAIFLNILTTQGYFNVSDRFLWKQTSNIFSKEQPTNLEISSVNIKSNTERVGIDKSGNMDAPSSPSVISWYQFGALPGEKGNAVFSGHRDSTWGPGVFYTLHKTKPGDEIKITNQQGETFSYMVFHSQEYLAAELPINQIFSNQKKEKLTYLITCAGTFEFFSKKYNKRILVAGILGD